MKLTALGSGYYRVYKNGVEVSKHTSEREALESAFAQEQADPAAEITYIHEYEVKVEAPVPPPPAPTPVPSPTPAPTGPDIFYAPDCIWNKKLDGSEPVHANSAGFISELYINLRGQNAWINAIPYGVPLFYTSDKDPLTPIYDISSGHALSVVTEILKWGIHLPANFNPAGGTDGHAFLYNVSTGFEYGFWKLNFNTTTQRWECLSAYIAHNAMAGDGTTNKMHVDWNSATASHINLGAGLIRKRDLEAGVIPHALAFATHVDRCARAVVYPAKTSDGRGTAVNSIPMGTRMTFKKDIFIDPALTPLTKMLIVAVRDHGMILRDTTQANGVAFYAEDTTQFGHTGATEIFAPYVNGKTLDKIVGNKNADGEFPWSKLVVLA